MLDIFFYLKRSGLKIRSKSDKVMLSSKLDNAINIVYFLRVGGKRCCRIRNDREERFNHIIPFCMGSLPLQQDTELLAVPIGHRVFFGFDHRKMRLRTTGGHNAFRKWRTFDRKIGCQTRAGRTIYKGCPICLLRA
jgi:hypothetical protein